MREKLFRESCTVELSLVFYVFLSSAVLSLVVSKDFLEQPLIPYAIKHYAVTQYLHMPYFLFGFPITISFEPPTVTLL